MSVEQHGGKPIHDTGAELEVPGRAPEHAERLDDFSESERNESWLQRYKKALIAAGAVAVAGATLAAGLAIGLKGGSEGGPTKEGQRPVATASANPGHETTPSTAASETGPDSWTADNLPVAIDVNGDGTLESFTGREQLVQALSLDVAKYPTAEDASKALLERFNTVVSWGANNADFAKYDGYSSADHERVGVGAAKQDVLLPAFQEALLASPAEGAQVMELPDTWASWVNDTAQEVNHRWIVTREQTPYKYSCQADASKAHGGIVFNSGDAATHLKHGTIFVECTDNFDQTDLGNSQNADGSTSTSLASKQSWFLDLQPQDGKWKVIGMQAEAALQ